MLRSGFLLALGVALCASPSAQVVFQDAADRDALRRWFVLLADAQFYRTTPDVIDCAALVRHAVREAMRSGAPGGLTRAALPAVAPAPHVRTTAAARDGALLLFRVTPEATDAPARYAEFADARTLIRLNARALGRDTRALRPGDLLYFRQTDQRFPDHLMVFVGPSTFEADGRDWVVYHTGPSADAGAHHVEPGEVRKVRLADLERHPSPRWRPLASNPRFVGVFRLLLFPM